MGTEVEYAAILTTHSEGRVNASATGRYVVSAHPAALGALGIRTYGIPEDGMLSNGARLYNDHGHPEYSTPECKDLLTLLACEKAGERLMQACVEACADTLPQGAALTLLKINTDHAGRTWGCHENYLVTPDLFDRLILEPRPELYGALVPFLVTRQLISGSGRVGGEEGWRGYQLSQRADFIQTVLGPDTTRQRPIVNSRDEPLADGLRFRRLHLVMGDSNMSEYATYLKLGLTRLILRMLGDHALACSLELRDPVAAMQSVSRRPEEPLLLDCGYERTARELQVEFLEMAGAYLARAGADSEETALVEEWGRTLDAMAKDPMSLCDRLDWAIKLAFLESVRADAKVDWDHPLLQELDFRYHDICPERSIYQSLASSGAVRSFPLLEAGVRRHMVEPPKDTRARERVDVLRGQTGFASVDWDHVVCEAGRFQWADPTAY
jgi:proteasome accessory factor A